MRDTLRNLLERGPLLMSSVRLLRDHIRARTLRPKPTRLGFRFAGNLGMERGQFEPLEVAFLRQEFRDLELFVDVGANIGYYTCLARSCGVPTVAIEPLAANLEILFANLQANGWNDIEVFPVGVGAAPALATIFGGGTGASLVRGWAGISEAYRATIPISTLDRLVLDRCRGKRVLFKMDVEGWELEALRGAERLLLEVAPATWLVEVMLSEHVPGGFNPRFIDVFECFWSAGYSAFSIDGTLIDPDAMRGHAARRSHDDSAHNFVFRRSDGPSSRAQIA